MTTEQTTAPDITSERGRHRAVGRAHGDAPVHGPQLARRRGAHRRASRSTSAFSPGELLKIALAGCSGLVRRLQAARTGSGDDVDVTIKVSGMSDDDEDRYPAFAEELVVDLSSLDPEARERLITVVHRAIDSHCTVGPHARGRRDRAADRHRGALSACRRFVEAALAKAVTIPSSHHPRARRVAAPARTPRRRPSSWCGCLEKEYLLVVQSAGGAVGATAAAPAVGTGVALALTASDIATFFGASAAFALAVASVHGIEVEDAERRRALLLTTILGDSGAKIVTDGAELTSRQRRAGAADAHADGDGPQGEHDDDPALRAHAGDQADRPGRSGASSRSASAS